MKWNVGKQDIVRVRRSVDSGDNGYDSNGRPVIPSEDALPILATVNPIPGEEILTLPEGERNHGQQRCLTESDIIPVDEDAGIQGDHIIYENERWEVRDVQSYRKVIPHNAARIRKVDRALWPPAPTLADVTQSGDGGTYVYLVDSNRADYVDPYIAYGMGVDATAVAGETRDLTWDVENDGYTQLDYVEIADGIASPRLFVSIGGVIKVVSMPSGTLSLVAENVVLVEVDTGTYEMLQPPVYRFMAQLAFEAPLA